MNLRSRLERLEKSGCFDFKPQDKSPKPCLQDLFAGEVIENEFGSFFRRLARVGGQTRYGPGPILESLNLDPRPLGDLYESIQGLSLERAVYVDTETTGLAGGSGTYAFLIGLAWFEDGELRVEQLFMREHSEERAMLHYLAPILENASGLVSFNGRSYDLQLLMTRFLMNRMRVCAEDIPHLDLLHLSRRIWGGGLPDCRLETLEHQILGRPREDDTPGWMVPQIFFRYLRSGDARPLVGVADHNYRDLLAMVGLVGCIANLMAEPLTPRRPAEDVGLGRLFEELGESGLARQLFDRALEGNLPASVRRTAMLRLARLWRREGDRRQAVQLWKAVLKEEPKNVDAAEELAKHLEHHIGDFGWALKLVNSTLRNAPLSPGRRRSFLDRRARLQRRLSQQGRRAVDGA